MTPEHTHDIVLWGSTQVGKTTALVAYLAMHATWVAEDEESRRELFRLRHEWNLLKQNQLVTGTAAPVWNPLRHRDGSLVRFRDIRGEHSVDSADEAAELRRAAGVLLFLEWPSHRSVVNDIAVHNALAQIAPHVPRALVITKCESGMTTAEFAECVVHPRGSAAIRRTPAALQRLLNDTPALEVFPITVYGWKDDLPAQYYNEFGQFVPWAIEPAMVERPFGYMLERVMAKAVA